MPSATLGLLFGIWLFQQQASLWSWAALVGLVVVLLCTFSGLQLALRAPKSPMLITALRRVRLLLWVACVGFLLAQARAAWRLADTLNLACQQQPIMVQAVVTGVPEVDDLGQHVDAYIVRSFSKQCRVPSHVRIHLYQRAFRQATNPDPQALRPTQPALSAGELWQMTVRFKRPHTTRNPHGFDYAAWCLAHQISAIGNVVTKAEMRRLQPFVWRLDTVIARMRAQVGARIAHVLGRTPESAVIRALVIGEDSQIQRADWQRFVDSGINHLISISGLHITMLASIGYALVLVVWRYRPLWGLVLPSRLAAAMGGSLVAIGYAALAGFSIPTQRTLFMLITVAVMCHLKRPLPFSWVLCCALWIVVIYDPWSVMAPGFWLSFGAVAVLSSALGGRLGKANWWRQALASQWVVTLAFVPVLLCMFNQVSLISPIANALAIPIVSLAIVPMSIVGALLPIDSALHLAAWLLAAGFEFLDILHRFALPVWYQHTPAAWAVGLAMLGLMVCLMPAGWPLRWAGLLCCLPLGLPSAKPLAPGQMHVHVLDVGQGLSVLVQTAQHQLLYDAGPVYGSQSDAGQRIVLPYLRHLGIRSLDIAMISHDDSDHVGGMASVLAGVATQRVLSSLTPQAHFFNQWRLLPDQHRGQVQRCVAGQHWQWDGVYFELLSPAATVAAEVKDNEKSCVLKVQSAYGSVLLTGDIERLAEQGLLEAFAHKLPSTVMIIPHHGSKTSSSQAFVQAVQPQIAIATLGYLNRFGHPKAEVMARYQAVGTQLYRSDHHGAVLLSFLSGDQPSVLSWRQAEPHYWEIPLL